MLVIVAASGCLALAWWQWSRFESTAGDYQNLGYALQWPLFAAFCFYAYFKFVRYEDAPPDDPVHRNVATELPEGLLPQRPATAAPPEDDDPALREYNAYLAELSKTDHEGRTQS